MSSEERRKAIEAEKGKALVRALHQSELEAAGARRAVALHAAETELDRIARRMPEALQAGLSMSDIARLTGLSRPTLYGLRARYGSVGDLKLAVLQALAFGPSTEREIAEDLGRPVQEVGLLVSDFFQRDWIDVDGRREYEDGTDEVEFGITAAGIETLENWTFEDE